ncbi:hypothetical protein [Nocardia pseudobrasiliensis]|uniref:Uncharacterized protein n=1 Tax=Nocardia pseudobrasiliensis TaxID=45979 RepID=A0A370IAI3_9NOCA|nr:hypothetical protein [Nocardia pseudobrasiliensis]RDI67732.1 hypothetical protein DFR76_102131 [Nocardia pseudobrasiliensis]
MTPQADLTKLGIMADTLHGSGGQAAGFNGIEGSRRRCSSPVGFTGA